MSSLVFKFDSPEEVADIAHHIKSRGTSLELSPMKVGQVGGDHTNQLLAIGNDAELRRAFVDVLGTGWKDYIVQGDIGDEVEG